MNVRHRRAHRIVWPLLLPALAAGIGLGIAQRPSPQPMAELPAPLAPPPAPAGSPLWCRDDAFDQAAVRLALYPELVELTVLEPLRRPDPSIWLADGPPEGGRLPAGAVLLGLLSDSGVQRLRLPPAEPTAEPLAGAGGAERTGHLVIFSLADGEVIASAALGGQG